MASRCEKPRGRGGCTRQIGGILSEENTGSGDMIPGVDKLVEVAASGVGSIAGTFLAPWRARREGRARIIAAEAEAKVLDIRARAHAEARELLRVEDPLEGGELEISDRITERIQYQEQKRLANMQAVLGRAAVDLEDKDVPETVPDHDWAARFFTEVQDVSSEEMQVLWAKVLAGEVERPGSTAARTLGLLKDLDRTTAGLFAKFCSACVYIVLEAGHGMLDARLPSLGGSAADNSLVDFGFNFSTLNRLNEHGLIISDYDSWSDFRFSVVRRSDEPPRPLLPFHHQGRQWVLVADATRHPGADFRIKGPALTFAGQELSRVVEQEPIPNYTERLEAFFLGQKFRMVRLDDLATRTNSMTFEQ